MTCFVFVRRVTAHVLYPGRQAKQFRLLCSIVLDTITIQKTKLVKEKLARGLSCLTFGREFPMCRRRCIIQMISDAHINENLIFLCVCCHTLVCVVMLWLEMQNYL